jgi:hypothetical protein
MVRAFVVAAMLAAPAPLFAQDVVKGDATAGLVSKTAKAEVHLIADPALNDKRLVLKIVVLNTSGSPQPFGPDAVKVSAGDAPVELASRESLIAGMAGGNAGARETTQAHAAASLPVNGSGQLDVTGFNGGMNSGMGGVPNAALDRAGRGADKQAVAQLDQVLLKPITIRANGADGGQVLTERFRKRPPQVIVAIAFAGETHRFAVKVPH